MKISGIDANLLIALDALLKERNVTRAATRLGVGQPALSHSLAHRAAEFLRRGDRAARPRDARSVTTAASETAKTEPSAFEGPVTLIFARKVKAGRETAYREWVAAFQQASRSVEGFLGASTMGRGAAGNEYISVVRFATFEHLRAWEESELRREWLEKLPPDTVEGEATVRRLEGLEFWFTGPGSPPSVAPSPHKMAFVLVIIVFALVSALTPVVRVLLSDAPQIARTAVMVAMQVGLMTYVIMPRVTRVLARWLFSR